MIREMELLFQASRTSPMLHEAAVVVEEGIAALRTERDELVLQNERLGDDIVAAEARCARLRQALRPFVEDYDFHAADYLADLVDGEEARVFTARTVALLIEHQRAAREALVTAGGHDGR